MRVLITGVKGQLGYDCFRELQHRGIKEILGVDKDELDITDEQTTKRFVKSFNPSVIIHCAGWTAVDNAENKPEMVNKVNVLGTKYLTEVASEIDAKIVYISTDYVFSGEGDKYYEVNDKTNPISVYGLSKLNGEKEVKKTKKHFVIRTSWVFGINGNNFVKTMLKLSDSYQKLSVVSDQIGSPTYTHDLANLICDMVETEKYGVYHATNEGICSWYEFAKEIFKQAGHKVDVQPILTKDYLKTKPLQAKRPLNSRLSKKSLDIAGFKRLPEWKDALHRYLKELKVV